MDLLGALIFLHVLFGILGHVPVLAGKRSRARNQQQTGLASPRRGDSRVHEWCPPCDVTHCPMVTSSTCAGNIILDMCNCCPICVANDMAHNSAGDTVGPNFDYDGPDPADYALQSQNQSEACSQITCPRHQVCMLNIQNLPICRCPTKFLCMKSKRKPVCGQDNVTYKSKCFLKMAQCDTGRNIPSYTRGKCQQDAGQKAVRREERQREREEKRLEREERRRTKQEKLDKKRRKRERKSNKRDRRRGRSNGGSNESRRIRRRNRLLSLMQ